MPLSNLATVTHLHPPPGSSRARLAAATALAAIGVLALAACSTPPEPSNLETPDAVWPSGEPFGQFADDPAAQAYGLFHVNSEIASNARDFSDPDLVNVIGVKRARNLADGLAGDLRTADLDELARLGPDPYLILDVIHQVEQSMVISCTYGSRNNVDSRMVFYDTVTFSPDGTAHLVSEIGPPPGAKPAEEYRAECDASDIPVGYFDPAPEPQTDRNAKVKGPAAADKYNLD